MAFVDSISTGAVLTWNAVAVDRLTDFGIHGICEAKDVTAQDSGGNRKFIPGLREVTFNASFVFDQKDTQHAALQADADAGTKRTLALTPLVGAPIFSIECGIESIGRPLTLGDVIKADFSFFVTDASTIAATGL